MLCRLANIRPTSLDAPVPWSHHNWGSTRWITLNLTTSDKYYCGERKKGLERSQLKYKYILQSRLICLNYVILISLGSISFLLSIWDEHISELPRCCSLLKLHWVHWEGIIKMSPERLILIPRVFLETETLPSFSFSCNKVASFKWQIKPSYWHSSISNTDILYLQYGSLTHISSVVSCVGVIHDMSCHDLRSIIQTLSFSLSQRAALRLMILSIRRAGLREEWRGRI